MCVVSFVVFISLFSYDIVTLSHVVYGELIMFIHCSRCGDEIERKRSEMGYKYCLLCGEELAIAERKSWCVAPMHKSNYMLITNMQDLRGLNNKGGIVK